MLVSAIWPVWKPSSPSCGCPGSGRSELTGRALGCLLWTAPPPSHRWLSSTGYGTGRWTWRDTPEPDEVFGRTQKRPYNQLRYRLFRIIISLTKKRYWELNRFVDERNIRETISHLTWSHLQGNSKTTSISTVIFDNFLLLASLPAWNSLPKASHSLTLLFDLLTSSWSQQKETKQHCFLPSWLPGCGPVGRPRQNDPCTT